MSSIFPKCLRLADDLPFLIYPEAPHGNDFRSDGDIDIGEDQAVEFEFEPALAGEAPGITVVGEAARQVAAAREGGAAEFTRGAQVAEDRIAWRGGFG